MKKIFILLCLIAISFLAINSADAMIYESQGDSFNLLEDKYEADEAFVFTATLNFLDGQAGGLVFGAEEDSHYYVFNMDRFENRVKVLYFEKLETGYKVDELYVDWFIGNDKMTESEKNTVNPRVRGIAEVDLKVVITPEGDKVYAEFFADGIKRFGIDNDIVLDENYQGGYLGFNNFNSKIDFTNVEIGKSDYAYYTEMYRQQYHFSQYSKWNNDPNGLVYYNGYYHLFFQTHPYNKYWGDMYWGHARSKDLINWEQLPISLFPDQEGYAWSGSARVYHKGQNPEMDSWFPNGDGNGLIAFYTRDGARQDQIIISSDDEGLTWTKRRVIPQGLVGISDRKISCRDPKVFPINNGEKDIWGMVISNMEDNTVYFLQSENMLDWQYAGTFTIFRPECVDVVEIIADDNTKHTVMTFEGREYLVGELKYDQVKREIYFEKVDGMDIRGKSIEEIGAKKMDFGPDSYATQSFFIDDPSCENYGKTISVSWFSGVPGGEASVDSGSFAAVRSRWNGSGFTMPVELGLVKHGDEYLLTQTPITLNNEVLNKTSIVSVENKEYTPNSENILKDVNTHQLEVIASFDNPNQESIEFKINIGEDEYTTIGWNKVDGYYVDRTNTSDGGINFHNYHRNYKSQMWTDTTTQTFYIISDNGGVEVFCGDFTTPFYVLTLASVYSTEASLEVSGDVTINSLEANEIGSIYKDINQSDDEGIIYLSKEDVRLDLELTKEQKVQFYSTFNDKPTWEIVSGSDLITLEEDLKGITIKSIYSGEAVIKVTCGNKEKYINVKVESGRISSDINFNLSGVKSGNWYMTSNGLIGSQIAGDGYILSTEKVKDCYYTAKFDLGSGAAAALVVRANEDMSDYVIANYDNNSRIVKVWTPRGELANVYVGDVDIHNMTLSVILEGNNGEVMLNGNKVATFLLTENDPKEGYLGLNVCATEAIFKEITLQTTEFTYNGGNLVVKGNVSQYIKAINNITLQNSNVSDGFYKTNGREIIISEEYFKTLTETGEYEFEVIGEFSTFIITVSVNSLPKVSYEDRNITVNETLNVFIGSTNVTKVSVNGKELSKDEYKINNMILTIDSTKLNVGNNTISINDEEFTVTVEEILQQEIVSTEGCNGTISISSLVLMLCLSVGLLLMKKKRDE